MKNPFEKFFGNKKEKKEKEVTKEEALAYLASLTPAKGWEILNKGASRGPLNKIPNGSPNPEKFDQARVEKVFPSKDLQRAFDLMWARNHDGIEGVNNKKKIVLEINERDLIDSKILLKGPAVYVGSGTDIEYPLLAGARNITMVDYGYEKVEDYIEDLKRRIEIIIAGKEIRVDGNHVSFDLDVGNGKTESVNIIFEPKQIAGGPFPLEKDKFVPPEEGMSLLVSYAPAGLLNIDPGLMEKVNNGGYILTDSMFIGDEEMQKQGYKRKLFETPELQDIKLFQKEEVK